MARWQIWHPVSFIFVIGLSVVAGCGGGVMSANDMKKYAIRRGPEVEVKTAPAAMQTTAPDKALPSATEESAAPDTSLAETSQLPTPSTPPATIPTDEPANTQESEASATSDTASESLSDRRSPPAAALDAEARARMTVENLKRIGAALEAYHKEKGVYPGRAMSDNKGRPLLSWRVELLPYLGYEKLYERFGKAEPWNSRRNSELVAHIPAVYQSPERFDERTNYLVPVASSTFFSKLRGLPASSIEDGAENTLLVLEADDVAAVPWSEPREYELDLNAPTRNLGKLRGDSMYLIWGGGEVGRVPTSAPRDALRAMFTFDAGEKFVAGQIDQPLFAGLETQQPKSENNAASTGESAAVGVVTAASTSPGRADNELAALAAKFLGHSAEAFVQGREREGLQWLYAAAILGAADQSWAERYQWVPALRRPLPMLRFGIGLDYNGPREKQVREGAVALASRSSAASVPNSWSDVTGELGEQIVGELASHWKECGYDPGSDASPTAPNGGRIRQRKPSLLQSAHGTSMAPGVYFLTAARETVLLQMARREAVDMLVIVDWHDAGHKWSAGITLLDVARREPILKLPRIQSSAVERSKSNPLADNPFVTILRQFSEFLDEQLTPQPLPSQIKPQHVARRLETLAATGSNENPLPALAEMRYYCERGLADETQLLLAYQALIGTKAGSVLILGGAQAKADLLKPWLPTELSTSEIAGSSRHSADD